MRKLVLTLTALILAIGAFAQPTLVWDQYVHPEGANTAKLYDGVMTADNGFIFVGMIFGEYPYSLWMLKVNSEGVSEGTINAPFSWEGMEYNHCELDHDGHLIVICNENIFQSKRGEIVKLTQDGQLVWHRQQFSVNSPFNDVCIADNGDYIVVGASGPPYSDLKKTTIWCYDEGGNELWVNYCEPDVWGEGIAICPTDDGGYAIAAQKYSGVSAPCLVVYEVDSEGDLISEQAYPAHKTAYNIAKAFDGSDGYIVATDSGLYGCVMQLVRLGTELVEDWTTVITGPDCIFSCVKSISPGDDYILYAGANYSQNEGFGVAGKMDYSGNVIWQQLVTTQGWTEFEWCTTHYDQNPVFVGSSCAPSGFPVYGRFVKYAEQLGVVQELTPAIIKAFSTYVSPNPFNSSTTISYTLPYTNQVNLTVYNTNGQLVKKLVDGYRDAGTHELTFDATNLASGIYFYHIKAGDYIATQRMVLVK